jgi:hypothetical protein
MQSLGIVQRRSHAWYSSWKRSGDSRCCAYSPLLHRWRNASYKLTAHATEMLRLSTIPTCGDGIDPVGSGEQLWRDPTVLVAEDQRHWNGEVELIEATRLRMRRRQPQALSLCPKPFDAFTNAPVPPQLHPFVGARRGPMAQLRKGLHRVEQMHLQHSNGIARAEHRRDIVRIVHILQHNGQVRLAPLQDSSDLLLALLRALPLHTPCPAGVAYLSASPMTGSIEPMMATTSATIEPSHR